MNFFYLFLILKSYVLEKSITPFSFSVVIKEYEIKVVEKNEIKWLINVDYTIFLDWINFRLKNDEKYNTKESFYQIMLIYSKSLIAVKNKEHLCDFLIFLKPQYPWNNQILNMHEMQVSRIKILEEKLKSAQKEIDKLINERINK